MDEYAAMLQNVTAQNNQWSAAQAQKQMDFQKEMSDTAHQREVADLKAAGLNPVLSAKLGGASTPTGAMGATDTSLTSALVDLLGMSMQATNSAASAAYSAAASNEGLFGLPLIRNPRQPWQILYNWIVGDEKVKEFYEDQLPQWARDFFGNPGSAESNGKSNVHPTSKVGDGSPTYGSKSRGHSQNDVSLKDVAKELGGALWKALIQSRD